MGAVTGTDGELLLYGSYGFTGSLIARAAADAGAPLILAGRNARRLRRQAASLGFPYRVAALEDAAALAEALEGVRAVLSLAGPYSRTEGPLVDACLRAGIHYLDVSGEHATLEGLRRRSEEAAAAGVTLLPGVGFDVVPSDCLALYVAQRLPDATRLEIAVQGVAGVSRGTALTMVEAAPRGGLVRREGRLVWVPAGWRRRRIPLGDASAHAVSVPLADLVSAYHTTGIPHITTYYMGPAALGPLLRATRLLRWSPAARLWEHVAGPVVRLLRPRPSTRARRGKALVWAEASDDAGHTAAALLRCPEPYTLTALVALDAALRVARGGVAPGYRTPALALGADYVLGFPGVERIDL